jgi:hypothetical protein
MNKELSDPRSELQFLPYTATSISVAARFIFMFLLYRNKSTNILSLIFCILSITSSSMWIYYRAQDPDYSVENKDFPMIIRSSTEISLLTISAIYIIRNRVLEAINKRKIFPIKEELINSL